MHFCYLEFERSRILSHVFGSDYFVTTPRCKSWVRATRWTNESCQKSKLANSEDSHLLHNQAEENLGEQHIEIQGLSMQSVYDLDQEEQVVVSISSYRRVPKGYYAQETNEAVETPTNMRKKCSLKEASPRELQRTASSISGRSYLDSAASVKNMPKK